MGLKVLIVDDEPESVEPLRLELLKLPDTYPRVVGFGDIKASIKDFSPNVVVLDLAQGNVAAGPEDLPGLRNFDDIWQHRFLPLVLYTAVPQHVEDDQRLKNPFVNLVQKGGGSQDRVVRCILEFQPHLSAIDETASEIAQSLNQALRDVAPIIFDNVTDPAQRQEMLVRSARRRVAASMDNKLSTGGPNLRCWEHYLCPPIADQLLTGDLIKRRGGETSQPSSYAVVLTPSCDLAFDTKRKPNVDRALVAWCTDVRRILRDLNLQDTASARKNKEKIKSALTQGYGRSCLPLPGLPGTFPAMAADFHKLALIATDEIGDGKRCERVASADNPFRELVAWAYMTNAGRPGLPDRDFDEWAEQIISAATNAEKVEG